MSVSYTCYNMLEHKHLEGNGFVQFEVQRVWEYEKSYNERNF